MERRLLSAILSLCVALTLVAAFGWVYLLQRQVQLPRNVAAQLNTSGAVMDSAEFLQLDGIDLNTADSLVLQEIPGIGPVLARRIVAYRNTHGPFGSVEELDAVQGIGAATLEKIGYLGYVEP